MSMTPSFRVAVLAGLVAGTAATLAQLLLWWLASVPLPDVLYRDTRLTAAMVLPHDIISLDQLFRPPSLMMWLAASLVHLALSVLYAAAFIFLASRLRIGAFRLLPAGVVFGLLLYVINLYGFTFLMPWFFLVRDEITLAAHAVFGLSLGAVVWANTRRKAPLLPI